MSWYDEIDDEIDDSLGDSTSDDRDAAIWWARELFTRPEGWLILDTETTGLRGAEIVQIGLLHPDGSVAMDSLVRPGISIPAAATAIHGITDSLCGDAPTLFDLLPQMAQVMHEREIVIYNKGFDQGVLYLQLKALIGYRAADDWLNACSWSCAMEQYAAFVGEISWRGDYKWQKLPSSEHSAMSDCKATLRLIQQMSEASLSTEAEREQR